MQEILDLAESLKSQVNAATSKLDLENSQKELDKLQKKSQETDFWTDNIAAQDNLKMQSKLSSKISPWSGLEKELNEVIELAKTGDGSLAEDLNKQLESAQTRFDELKEQLKFSGPYDENEAIISIHAGAGGVDAQDWAEMLLRMYLRWAEKSSIKTKILQESRGEEAGIKSVSFEIEGDFAYGKLKGEHGVHRLVRLSPFNADHLRQTSFAKVEIVPKITKPDQLELDENDLKIDVFRSGGHGGQSVNTTDSAVRITHLPTSITVSIQNERSQLQNRETALTVLRSRLAQLQLEQHKDHLSELKGPNQSAEWGNQIRSYVLHPYKQVKDLRTGYETTETDKVLGGDLDKFIGAYLDHTLGKS